MVHGFFRFAFDLTQFGWRRRSWLPILVLITPLRAGLFLLLASALLTAAYWFQAEEATRFKETVRVGRQSFSLQVHERGVVHPARVMGVKSNISSNRAKLVWLQDEGSQVSEGSLIARFDTQPFNDELEKAEQRLADVRARLQDAEKALQLQEEENASKLEDAKHRLEIARIEAEDLRSGTGRLKRRKLLLSVNQARRAQQIARKELEDFEAMLAKGHISQRERDLVVDDYRKDSEALELRVQELNNFDKYEMPRLLREAELMVDAAVNEMERLHRIAALEIRRRESDVIKQRRDLDVALERLDRAHKDLINSDVRAPIDGILLYVRLPRSEKMQKVQVGDAVWFGQTFLEIPDTHDLVVEVSVREIDVAKLAVGMEALIELDAFPGRRFRGQLISIDSLAQSGDETQHVSRYSARVKFNERDAGVHVGMSADVRITYRLLDDVVAVPTAAIEFSQGAAYIHQRTGNLNRRVFVELGEIGPQWAEVRSGLDVGDEVEVNPR